MEFFIWIAMLSVYFFPSIVAFQRKHRNFASIFATNLLLGWIVIGWIIAMIWGLSNNRKPT